MSWTWTAARSTAPTSEPSKGGTTSAPSPVDRGRRGSKHHLICDGGGIPLAVTLTGGNRNDITQLIPLVDAIPQIRGRRGRPRRRARELFSDRGYDHDSYRRQLRARGITPRIARRGIAHGSGLRRQRWVVERSFAWLHAFKRLRTHYERRADIHLGLLQLACVLNLLPATGCRSEMSCKCRWSWHEYLG
jgi:transposase